jgi:hypothetical protein
MKRMELLTVEEDGNIELNKIWLKSIPVFDRLIIRDKGTRGVGTDYSAAQKYKAKRDFKLIYLYLSPDSPYSELAESERLTKCLEILEYKVKNFNEDNELQDAIVEYKYILDTLSYKKASEALQESTIKKIEYIKNVDFNKTDKVGRIVVTPKEHSDAIKALALDLETAKDFKAKFINAFVSENNRLKATLTISTLEKNNAGRKEFSEDVTGL